ncbi:serine hydrolase domain-containing protein [Nocardia sp. NPDC127606]|uniref:serine hydrolase domain-containing protein n=1 Tax=Nocardia sp. NPDC127606 TaxID=3345406 RepID=UPI003643715C
MSPQFAALVEPLRAAIDVEFLDTATLFAEWEVAGLPRVDPDDVAIVQFFWRSRVVTVGSAPQKPHTFDRNQRESMGIVENSLFAKAAGAEHYWALMGRVWTTGTRAKWVQVRIHDSQGDWSAAAGATALGGDQPVPTNARFRIGSITKMFTAAVVLQLVGEGVLGLDDPVARYLPSFGLDERITVRMILGHTSGLPDYTDDNTADASYPVSSRGARSVRKPATGLKS